MQYIIICMYIYNYIYILIFKRCSRISHEKTVSESILFCTISVDTPSDPEMQEDEHPSRMLFWCFSRYDLVRSAHVFYASCDYLIVSTFCVNHVFCHTTYVYGSSWDILRRPSKRDHHGSDPIGDSVSNVRTAPLEIGRAPTTGQGLQWESWILVREFSSGSFWRQTRNGWMMNMI
jgi:hypothetical protein